MQRKHDRPGRDFGATGIKFESSFFLKYHKIQRQTDMQPIRTHAERSNAVIRTNNVTKCSS